MYSRPSGGLDVLYLFMFICFIEGCLLFFCLFVFALSFWVVVCISEKTIVKTTNNKTDFREKQKTTKIQLIQPEPERYSRPSGGLDVLYLLFCCFSLMCCLFVFVFLLLRLLLLSFCLSCCLNTIHYTKHKQTWNGFVHDLCQMLKVMFKFISNYMTFAADLKVVCII